MYVLDTDVLSLAAPYKPERRDLRGWLQAHSGDLFLSTITLAEISFGIEKVRLEGNQAKADQLTRWLSDLQLVYADRILDADSQTALLAGQLLAKARLSCVADRRCASTKQERRAIDAPSFEDATIAATAVLHRYTVLTHNVRHFQRLGVPWHDPCLSLPDQCQGTLK